MKKVLLIGLGGTGCKVVSKVKRMVKEAEAQGREDKNTTVRFLGIDTDINQKDAPQLDIIRTSRNAMVSELLRSVSGSNEWFPENQMLHARYMTRGAGQCRPLSRLALADTMQRPGAMQKLEDAIRYLQRETGEPNEGLKVMIVSSFAGGTGSGIFLQIPLYLRKFIEENYAGGEILIRGLFALPDIFIQENASRTQMESMYANAYASLKELAFINKVCYSDNTDLIRYDMKIDDLFNSRAILEEAQSFASADGTPKASRRPYDYIFFMDILNTDGNVLEGGIGAYLDEMSKVTYMQLFGPMATTADSREDNLIMEQISSDGEAIYGSSGSAKIVYPYESILRYCSCRTLEDVVSSQWDVFDKAYREEVKVLKEKQNIDVSVQIPTLGSYIIREVNKKLEGKSHKFKFLRDGCTETISEEVSSGEESRQIKKLEKKHILFESKVHEYVEGVYNDDAILKTMAEAADFVINPSDRKKDSVAYHVSETEDALIKYYESVDEQIYNLFNTTADSIFPGKFGGGNDELSHAHNIRNLLEKAEGGQRIAVHPLAARYLLYALGKSLEDNQKELEGTWEIEKEKIKKYWSIDRKPKTKDIKEGWSEVVPGFFKLSSFKNLYAAESKAQKEHIKNYGLNKFKWLVYQVVINRINALLNQYQKVFGALENVENRMRTEINQLEEQFERNSVSEIYLCASKKMLGKTYKSLQFTDSGDGLGEIYSELFKTTYIDAMKALENASDMDDEERDKYETLRNQWYNQSVTGMFIDKVLPHYQKMLQKQCQDALNINVYQALKKQAAINAEETARKVHSTTEPGAEEIDRERKKLISLAFRKASPYLTSIDYHDPNPQNPADNGAANRFDAPYWGLSADVQKQIEAENPGIKAGIYLTADEAGVPAVVSSPMYSNYELSCYRAIYSLRLSEIRKFRESNNPERQGNFYKNYLSRVNKMLQGRYGRTDEGMTPHIDKRWHSRQYLPMISDAMDENDVRKAARAMWLAYFYRYIEVFTNETNGQPEIRTDFSKMLNVKTGKRKPQTRILLFDGKVISGKEQVYEVFKAFQQNDLVTTEMLDVLDPLLEEDSIGKAELYDFEIIPITAGLIGISSIAEARNNRMIAAAATPEMLLYLKAKSFNTNALTLLGKFLHNNLASSNEKEIVSDELWKILQKLLRPSQGRQMAPARFKELLMKIFMNSPYITEENRIRDNVSNYILDAHFSDTMQEYDEFVEEKEKEKKKKNKGKGKTSAAASATAPAAASGTASGAAPASASNKRSGRSSKKSSGTPQG